jgi:transposase
VDLVIGKSGSCLRRGTGARWRGGRFDGIDICEIFVHWHAGRSKHELAASLGLSRNTVRKYVAAAEAAGMVPGGPAVSQKRWAELAREWFPELADTRLRQVTWPAIEAHRDYIVAQLKVGVTMATIHQRLADERGLAASVASLRRYVAANLPEEARRAQVRALRPGPPEPSQEAQVDYGQLGRWADPATGRRHVVNAFAMVLCCSRLLFVRPVTRMDQRAWTECHATAFEFFGGVPARLVPDNPKTGVDRPDLHDPRLNRSYAELAGHYGCLVDPTRSRNRVIKRRSSGRCRISGHRSGAAGSSPACSRYRPMRCAGRLRSRGSGRLGRWTAPPRPRCSPRWRRRTPAWCRRRAAEIGPACAALIAVLVEDNALYRLRAAQGVLGLADKHQPGRLEAACAKAAAAGDPSYRTVKGILAAAGASPPGPSGSAWRVQPTRST